MNRLNHNRWKAILCLSLAATILPILTVVLLKFAAWPYVWIAGLGSIIGFAGAARVSGRKQYFFIVFASICLAASLGEAITGEEPILYQTSTDAPYISSDSNYGWRAIPNAKVRATKIIGKDKIYNVPYTIDSSGFRISMPNVDSAGVAGCVIFLGDSFTFGEGVRDEQAYPYQVGLITKGKLRVMNLGLSGYGPHHMLTQVQDNNVTSLLKCTPSHVIYLAIYHHVSRVAGKAVPGGPKYVLTKDGSIERQGNFGHPHWNYGRASLLERMIQALKHRSNMWMFFNFREPHPTDDDMKLYVAIVEKARLAAVGIWPDAKFHILLWDAPRNPDHFKLRSALKGTGWQIHDVHEVLAGYWTNPLRYRLDKRDAHPNAHAYSILAQHVAKNILVD